MDTVVLELIQTSRHNSLTKRSPQGPQTGSQGEQYSITVASVQHSISYAQITQWTDRPACFVASTSELCMNAGHQTLYRGKTETLAPTPALDDENHTIRRGYRQTLSS